MTEYYQTRIINIMKKLSILFLSLIVFYACQEEQNKKDDSETQEVIAVKTGYPEPYSQPLFINTSGQITAKTNTKYSFKIGGVVQSILVEEGDRVTRGQKLATLHTDEIDAQVQQAELAVSKAKRDETRARTLYQDSIATLEDFQNAQTALEVAERKLRQVKFNQKYAVIYAVDNGYITDKLANDGEVVSPGNPLLITSDASSANGYVLECGLTDREWASVASGDRCTIQIDAYPGKTYHGKVSSKSFRADPVSGAFRVELKLTNLTDDLAIGMYGSANIQTNKTIDGFTVPYKALILANGKKGQVHTINNDGKPERKSVIVKELLNDKVLLSDGVGIDDRIIISNSAFLTPSSSINIID